MKAKGFLLGLVLLIFIGGYSAYWYINAQQIEKAFKEELAGQQYATITYDAIQKSGFPFSFQLALVNPKVQVKNEAISFDLDGKLAARWSLFGALKDIDMAGKSRFAMPMGEEGKVSEIYVEGNTVAEIDSIKQMADKGVFKISQAKMRSSDELAVGVFDWTFDLVKIAYDVQHPNNNRSIVDVDVELQGGTYGVAVPAEVPDGFDFYKVLVGTVAEKSGKTNSSFTLKCDMPSVSKFKQILESPLSLFTEDIPSVSIELKKCGASNSLTTSDMLGAIHINEDEQHNIVFHITADGFVQYLAAYREAILASIDDMVVLAKRWEPSEDLAYIKKLLLDNSAELKNLVPHPERLGKIEAAQDLLIVVNKRTLNWHVAVNNLGLWCDLYGISLKADAQARNNSIQAEVGVTLKNASNLIEEAVGFYNRIEGVVNLFEQDTQQHLKPLPATATKKIVAFLGQLSTNKDDSPNDLHINITYNDGKLQIGPLTREEARAQLEALWTEIMLEALPAGKVDSKQ